MDVLNFQYFVNMTYGKSSIEHIVTSVYHILECTVLEIKWSVEGETHWSCIRIALVSNATKNHRLAAYAGSWLADLCRE